MFDYDRRLLPNSYLATLEEGVHTIDSARARTGASIGYPGWGFIYHLLLCHLNRDRAEYIVETGTNLGCTSIILAQALVDAGCEGRVLSFELNPNNVAQAKQNLEAAGLAHRVQIIAGDSRLTLADSLAGLSGIRCAFLDASHLMNDALAEFETVLPHLADDALVLFDNTYAIAEGAEDARVNGALKLIAERYGGNLINLEFVSWFTPGLALWQRRPKL